MNNKFLVTTSLVVLSFSFSFSQSFAPAPGQPGSTAIALDSSIIHSWATGATIQRGLENIANPNSMYASFGTDDMVLNAADLSSVNVVSLGDGGIATLTFDFTITNGDGPDFVVFENGFADNFIELGFVEVSSDGVNFVRFPATSEAPTDVQTGSFSFSDCRYFHNLAGKYRAGFGTPFDLEDLVDSLGIDLNAITHVRIIDVVGTIDPNYATYDQFGTAINDLYPTEFESGGFDLDAVAIINAGTLNVSEQKFNAKIFPNPTQDVLTIEMENHQFELVIRNMFGQEIARYPKVKKRTLSVKEYASQLLFFEVISESESHIYKVEVF